MQAVIDCCAAVGSSLLCGPHQVALGVFTGAGPTEKEWAAASSTSAAQPSTPRARA